MPIPPLNEHGLLPAGIHAAGWGDIEAAFLTNVYREKLYRTAKSFFDNELPPSAAGLDLIVGGSFLSDKGAPDDIEATLYVPAQLEFQSVLGFGTEQAHNRIKQEYRVDFYITLLVPGCNDLGLFFQYVGPKTAAAKGLREKDLRGVIKVVSWKLG
jgi:hypothetical protein